MKLWSALRKVLPVLALLGLVLGPLSLPAATMTSVGEPSAAMDMGGMDMGEDMPCCPTKQAPPCGKSCPLTALCFATSSVALPTLSPALAFPILGGLMLPTDEARWETRAERPPPRPPRV